MGRLSGLRLLRSSADDRLAARTSAQAVARRMGAAAAGDPAALRARGGNPPHAARCGRNEGGPRRARLHSAARQRLGRSHHDRHAAHFLLLRLGVRLLAGDRPALSRLVRACGVFLGLAFLSKYFAVLLGFAYVVHVALSPRGQRDWRALALVVLSSLPFAAVNLWWNYEHCWANLMFNLYNRHDTAGWSWKTPLVYAVSVLYVL